MQLDPASRRWFALQIRPGRETLSSTILRAKGYDEFLPVCSKPGRARATAAAPLFPGYLFCRLGPDVLAPIVTTPGVIRIVGCGPRPAAVADEEIENVRRITESGLPRGPHPYLQTGARVRVSAGPLAGAQGILVQERRQARLVVAVTLLQRSVAVDLDPDWVTPEKAG